MSFNYTVTVQPVTNLTVQAGVQSVLLTWTFPADYSYAEVWYHSSNSFASATKIGSTTDIKFLDENLTPNVVRYYWVRVVRVFSASDTKYSTTVAGSATPSRASLGNGQVATINVAANAITTRSTYEETGNEYVQYGKDSGGGVVPAGDETWTLSDINFTGDGNTQVITCICRQSETPVWFRTGNSSVWAKVRAQIVNKTTGVVVDEEELTTAGIRVEQQGLGSAYLTFTHHRDFNHNFIIPTVLGNNYCVRFRLTCGADDSNNYILWASTLRQVLWQVYKR